MWKRFSIVFTFLLLFQLITPGLAGPIQIDAEGKDDIFTDVNINDETGIATLSWSVTGEDVKGGETATKSIPDGYEVDKDESGDLTDDTGVVESLSAEGTSITLTFNDEVEAEGNKDASGEIVVNVKKLDQAEKENDSSDNDTDNNSKNSDKKSDEKKTNKNEENNDSDDVDNENSKDEETQDSDNEELEKSENNDDKNNVEAYADEEKHGFKLELDEILDLDDEAFDEQHPMDPHKEFKVKLDWELEDGHNYVAGDTETFDLPKGIKIKEGFSIELKDENGLKVADAVITSDKKVELTFDKYVETHSDISGWIEIISELDTEEVEEEDGEIVIDPIGEEGELRIPIEKENKDKTIEKKGTPDGYNADEIDWEVIVNKNKTSLKYAKVTDDLPEGTEYKDGSLKVTKLKVDLNGNVLGDGEEVDITPEVNEEGKLTIPLGDTNDAYRVEYVTTVTDDEETSFKNNATLTDKELDDVSADSTITINRGEPLKKGAVKDYDPETGIIEWYLEFNYNQKDLNDVTLADNWTPAGKMDLVDGSLTFQEMTIDENGNATPNGDPVDPSEIDATENQIDDGFEVSGITTDKAYYVVYQTKVKDRELDGFRMENLASFEDNEAGNAYNIGQFVGEKSAGTIDYDEKTIDWTIKVNMDHQQMNDVMIEDTIGEGLTLVDDSIEMTIGGQPKTDFELENGNPFKLTNIGDTDQEIIVTYKTEFDADNVPDHIAKNKADITWTPEGEEDSVTKGVKAETELNEHTQNNDWKNGFYDPKTKEITWEIIANYRENDIADLNIVDKPQGNQQIIDGSAVVKELNIDADGLMTEGDTVNDAATIDEDDNTLEVALGETNKAYKITYKTSLAGLDEMQDEYVNEAEVFDGDDSLSEIDAKVGVVKESKYGDKSGKQDGKQVLWSIDVNLVQQKIKDLKLVDEISGNQEYLEDSIKVYHANIDGDGNTSKGDEFSSDKYTLDIDQDNGEFIIEWKDAVERAFIVDYSTLFFDKHGAEVRNDYTITGDSIEEEDDSASGSDSVGLEQLGSGGGEGTAGYLVIDKIDTTDGQEETKLAGAKFDLIDADTGEVLKSGITDEDGQIDFGRLIFGDYILKETKVPGGYVTPEEEQTIEINEKYTPEDNKAHYQYTVENYKPVFAVELYKTDVEGNALEDAEFTLYDADNKEIAKATTDEDGKILFKDLKEAGTYYAQETKAPEGYILDETKHEVTIGEKEQEPIKVTAENATRGNVVLTKTDVDTEENLEGVEFELQKKDDSGDYEKVGETYTTDKNGQIQTENTLEAGSYQFVETEGLDGYRTNGNPVTFTVDVNSAENQELTMENEQYKGSVKLVKKDAATDQALKGAEFKLVDSDGEVVKENLATNTDGEIEVNDLFLGEYQLIETKAPEGYEKDDTPIDIDITEDNQVVEKTMTNNKITDITVEKKWNNDDGDTESVTINLLLTDETVELNADNDWTATFEKLDVYDDAGEAIDYQVEELDVDGYNSTVTGDASDGFIVTNTETTSVSGEKTWKDDHSDERPDQITVKLLADGEKVSTEEVTSDSDWKYEFANLDKYDEDGEEITYTVDEIEIDGYEADIDGFDIKNVRVGTTSVQGEKTWKDEDPTDRPDSIKVNLSREVDGEADEDFSESKTVEPNDQGDWVYEFTDLDEFDDNGKAFTYTVAEDDVPEKYESIIDGYDITNVRIGETEVSGTKYWKDDNVEDRPEFIEVNLLRDDVVIGTKKVNAEGDWKYSFDELDKYDDEGHLYEYAIQEQDVEGYDSEVEGEDITNTRSEEKSIEVTKGWLDDDSKDRPDSVEVYLKQNGEAIDKAEIKASNNWKHEFTDLAAYDEDGKTYEYTVEEKEIDGYESTVDGFNITNLLVGETKVSGTKTWLDDNSEDRPEEITVHLLANGDKTDKKVTVDAETDWEYEFAELNKYDDQGKEIAYSVDEETVDGYEKAIDVDDITNLRVGKTEVTGEKEWNEVDKRYRPDTITVQLLANGEEEDTIEVSDKTDWSYGFTGLDKYDDQGEEIIYTVEEPDVPTGYTSKVDGYTITNAQDSTKVTGEKSWEEVGAEYRPDKVTVQLLANGEKESTIEVSEDTAWTYEFTDLAKYDKSGEEITYTVEEANVPNGYDSEVDGYSITNTQKLAEISGEKKWDEVDERYRPNAVKVQLLANGEEEAAVYMSEDTDWEYAFTDLAKCDKKGEAIKYTVKEIDVPKGYESEVNGFEITNTQQSTEVSGEKIWKEVDDQYRPDDVTIHLFANGEKEESIKVTVKDDWKYTFTELAKYDKDGKEVVYTIKEKDVAGYTSEIEGFNVANTQKTTEVSGEKTWLDDDSEDRPTSIKIQLKNEKEVVEEKEVTAEDEWEYIFTDIPKYDKKGKEIEYTVDEEKVEGYEKSIENFDITNTRTGKVVIEGTKSWQDDESQDRPKSITVNLLQNGVKVDSLNVTLDDDWAYSFTDLDKYDEEGVGYNYTVKEEPVEGYETKIDGFDITNVLKDDPDKEASGEKDNSKSDDDHVEASGKGSDSSDKQEVADKTNKNGDQLPQTGEDQFTMMIALGVFFLIAGGIMIFRVTRREQ